MVFTICYKFFTKTAVIRYFYRNSNYTHCQKKGKVVNERDGS